MLVVFTGVHGAQELRKYRQWEALNNSLQNYKQTCTDCASVDEQSWVIMSDHE